MKFALFCRWPLLSIKFAGSVYITGRSDFCCLFFLSDNTTWQALINKKGQESLIFLEQVNFCLNKTQNILKMSLIACQKQVYFCEKDHKSHSSYKEWSL